MVAVLETCLTKVFGGIYIQLCKNLCEWCIMRENKVIIMVIICCVKIHLISECVACGSQCNPHQRVRLLISYCLHSSVLFIPICCAKCGVKPKSCDRSYVHSCIPWILDDLPSDPSVGTANDVECSLL